MISMPKKRRQAGMYTTRKDEITGWLFTAPALICFLMFVLIPTCAMIALSFTQYRMLTPPEWTGVDNYVRLFTTDAKISKVALNTLKLSSVSVVISISIGLVLALLITSRKNGLYSYVIRLFYFFPNIVASSFIAIVWAILLSKGHGRRKLLSPPAVRLGTDWIFDGSELCALGHHIDRCLAKRGIHNVHPPGRHPQHLQLLL